MKIRRFLTPFFLVILFAFNIVAIAVIAAERADLNSRYEKVNNEKGILENDTEVIFQNMLVDRIESDLKSNRRTFIFLILSLLTLSASIVSWVVVIVKRYKKGE